MPNIKDGTLIAEEEIGIYLQFKFVSIVETIFLYFLKNNEITVF